MKGENLEDYFFGEYVERGEELSLDSVIRSSGTKYIQKSSKYPTITDRDYFDPFHANHPSNSSAQLTSPIKEDSQHLDEFSSVAGHYFKDIIIPRVNSRKSNSRKKREAQSANDKEYVFQQTSCLPQLRLKTTAVRHRKLPPPRRIQSANTRHSPTLRSTKSSPLILPSSCPFQNVSVPESIELTIYPYSSLLECQAVSTVLGKDSIGHVIEIHQNCTFSELKVCILNGALCSLPSAHTLSKEEYAKKLRSFRIWILDPGSPFRHWIQLRSQEDWERVKVSKWLESTSGDGLKLMYDDGRILPKKSYNKHADEVTSGNDDVDDSVTLNTHPRRDSDSLYCGHIDPMEYISEDRSFHGHERPRLHLLTERKPPNEHNSPIKQQKMAKILEQRIILSRI